ncbi:MAG: FMN-binding glutamate synthase family protein, partial [Paracoccaceae bacterium]
MIVLWSRYSALFYSAIIALGSLPMLTNGPLFKLIFIISLSLFFLGLYDFSQKKRPVLANFPIIGRFRFIFESIRPELRQYFWESDKDELPY